MYTCIYVRIHITSYVYIYTYMPTVNTHKQFHIYIYAYICMYFTYTHIFTHVFIFKYIDTCANSKHEWTILRKHYKYNHVPTPSVPWFCFKNSNFFEFIGVSSTVDSIFFSFFHSLPRKSLSYRIFWAAFVRDDKAPGTGLWRCIGCLKHKLQVSFRKRATKYMALCRKMTYEYKASYAS